MACPYTKDNRFCGAQIFVVLISAFQIICIPSYILVDCVIFFLFSWRCFPPLCPHARQGLGFCKNAQVLPVPSRVVMFLATYISRGVQVKGRMDTPGQTLHQCTVLYRGKLLLFPKLFQCAFKMPGLKCNVNDVSPAPLLVARLIAEKEE